MQSGDTCVFTSGRQIKNTSRGSRTQSRTLRLGTFYRCVTHRVLRAVTSGWTQTRRDLTGKTRLGGIKQRVAAIGIIDNYIPSSIFSIQ